MMGKEWAKNEQRMGKEWAKNEQRMGKEWAKNTKCIWTICKTNIAHYQINLRWFDK